MVIHGIHAVLGASSFVVKTQTANTSSEYLLIAKWVNSEEPNSQKVQSEFEEFCQRESVNLEELRPVFDELFEKYKSGYSEEKCSSCRMGTIRDLLEISSRKLNADEDELARAAELYINYKRFHKNLIEKNNAAIRERKINPEKKRDICDDRSTILKLMKINRGRLAKNFRDDNLNKFVTNVSNWILDDVKRGELLDKLRKIDSERQTKNSILR